MKYKLINTALVLLLGSCNFSQVYWAQESKLGTGDIEFSGKEDPNLKIRHPETLEDADPGVIASTTGALRIDFAPQLSFDIGGISKKDAKYLVNAQLYKGEMEPSGNFVQVSDYRGSTTGWKLQVRQESQFQQSDRPENQLNGAVLSFDKAWTNTSAENPSDAPLVSKEVVQMNNIGDTYTLADATVKHSVGAGTWNIVFGASKDNINDQDATLSPRLNKNGKVMTDPDFNNQEVYMNSAINLSIPGETKKVPGAYSTVLTWIIAELP
ncbi:hypothetical protein UAY_00124 [Enterococcus moraviensis ATCC BAA-383]|uniref:WxL domain-containing protein n=1 Tax=Enterococcus moraviensis ATCC BAA-383 TaxID=1158609 RepID=R2U255_9ENTE|nr:WxL domain-containing protein [Enterococcus moraviensis]EOI06782.1 hypothetical protein UAY_00124 [Enterococcus moraviensis ATCC BAA-383]EOT65119.1 hypothetical protein I586_02853 [Enterococcus moraviensis ATCC BAA-383]